MTLNEILCVIWGLVVGWVFAFIVTRKPPKFGG